MNSSPNSDPIKRLIAPFDIHVKDFELFKYEEVEKLDEESRQLYYISLEAMIAYKRALKYPAIITALCLFNLKKRLKEY